MSRETDIKSSGPDHLINNCFFFFFVFFFVVVFFLLLFFVFFVVVVVVVFFFFFFFQVGTITESEPRPINRWQAEFRRAIKEVSKAVNRDRINF